MIAELQHKIDKYLNRTITGINGYTELDLALKVLRSKVFGLTNLEQTNLSIDIELLIDDIWENLKSRFTELSKITDLERSKLRYHLLSMVYMNIFKYKNNYFKDLIDKMKVKIAIAKIYKDPITGDIRYVEKFRNLRSAEMSSLDLDRSDGEWGVGDCVFEFDISKQEVLLNKEDIIDDSLLSEIKKVFDELKDPLSIYNKLLQILNVRDSKFAKQFNFGRNIRLNVKTGKLKVFAVTEIELIDKRVYDEVVKNKIPKTISRKGISASGMKYRDIMVMITPILDNSNEVVEVLTEAVDVTEVKERDRLGLDVEELLRWLGMFIVAKDPTVTGVHIRSTADIAKYFAGIVYDDLSKLTEVREKYSDIFDPALTKDEQKTKFMQDIWWAGFLHDIGKISISDRTLMNPGALSQEEFLEMKLHTTVVNMIFGDPKNRTLKTIRDVAMLHHEKWDGSGYPIKLLGEDIPLVGQLINLVDVYSAVTTVRAYKRAWSHEKAIALILEGIGVNFNPYLVGLFEKCESKMYQIKVDYEMRTFLIGEDVMDIKGDTIFEKIQKISSMDKILDLSWDEVSIKLKQKLEKFNNPTEIYREAYRLGLSIDFINTVGFLLSEKLNGCIDIGLVIERFYKVDEITAIVRDDKALSAIVTSIFNKDIDRDIGVIIQSYDTDSLISKVFNELNDEVGGGYLIQVLKDKVKESPDLLNKYIKNGKIYLLDLEMAYMPQECHVLHEKGMYFCRDRYIEIPV